METAHKTMLEGSKDAQSLSEISEGAIAELNGRLEKLKKLWKNTRYAMGLQSRDPFKELETNSIYEAMELGFRLSEPGDIRGDLGDDYNDIRVFYLAPSLLISIHYTVELREWKTVGPVHLKKLKSIKAARLD